MAGFATSHGAFFGGGPGGFRVAQGRFVYRPGGAPIEDLDMSPQQGRTRAAATVAGALALLAVPSAGEVYAGVRSTDAVCDVPLANWLVADGAAALVLMALMLILYCRLCHAAGDEEVQMVRREDVFGGTALAQYEERQRKVSTCEHLLFSGASIVSLFPVGLLLLGAFWRLSTDKASCDASLLTWTGLVLGYKTLVGLALCCCWPCCLAGAAAAAVAPPAVATWPRE